MFTTNKDVLFKNLTFDDKQKFYQATKTKIGARIIDDFKNERQEQNTKKILTGFFPKSKIISQLFSKENAFGGKNNKDLKDLNLHKYDIYLVLKKHKLV